MIPVKDNAPLGKLFSLAPKNSYNIEAICVYNNPDEVVIKSNWAVTKLKNEIHLKKKNTVKFEVQSQNDFDQATAKFSFFMGIIKVKE